MRTRYGVSPWIHRFPTSRRPDYPRQRGARTADVVIVGAGLTGCATAYTCAVAGLRPMLIERDRVGHGSASRSAGLLLPDPGPPFREVVAAHGLRSARHVFQTWRRASLDAAALIKRLGIPCGLEVCDEWIVAGRGGDTLLRRERSARAEAGLEASQFGPSHVERMLRLGAPMALRARDGFRFDPYRALLGMAAAAVKRGAEIHERSHVRRIRFGRKDVEVTTESGVIRARLVIVTTGTATAEFKPLVRHFRRRERYLVLTEPLSAAVRRQLADPSLVIRTTDAPPWGLRMVGDRLLLSGGDQALTPSKAREAVLIQRTGQLMYELLTKYPVISGLQPEYGWEAPYGETSDGLMRIGSHRNYPHHLFALGGEPDSLTGAFLAARILVRAAQGRPEKGDEVLGFGR